MQFKQLHPNLKVLISIGGWNPPTYKQLFDTAASKQAQRQAFVGSCINMFIQGNIASGVSSGTVFDGFDIDWEFPNANATANFTALMTEFRNELTTLSGTTGKTYLVLADLAAVRQPRPPGKASNVLAIANISCCKSMMLQVPLYSSILRRFVLSGFWRPLPCQHISHRACSEGLC